MSIGELVDATRNGKSISQTNENYTGYVLSLRAVHDVSLDLKEAKPIILPDHNATKYNISEGDVFVSRANTIDLVGLSSVAMNEQDRTIFPDLLIKLQVKKTLIRPRYLAYALRAPESRKQIKERAVGSSQSMVKISGARLKQIKIPVPPLDIQDTFIEQFDELHDLATRLKEDLCSKELSALKQGILRKAFAGEL